MKRVAAVILAAGASSRLGEPKQLVMLAGERLLERAVRIAAEAGCAPIVVVLGSSAGRIREECALGAALIVVNEEWSAGMGSSVGAGVARLREDFSLRVQSVELRVQSEELEGVILMTCDQPAVSVEHIEKLMGRDGPIASSYAGRRGVPAYFPRAWFAELLLLDGDAGARALLQAAPTIALAGGELDIDTPEALEAARAVYE